MGILGELWVKLGLKNDNLKKGLKDSEKEVSAFTMGMKKLGGMLGAVFSIGAVLKFTHQTAELANKAKGVKNAFQALNNPALLGQLRKATMGTVDDLQLMQKAVQANNFKIPLDQLATYMEFASKRAQETGQSVDYLVDSIIMGLGRQSVQILDNLGLSAAEIKENMKGGASMAEAVGKIIKEQMSDAATEIDNSALATQRLQAAWANLQTTIGGGTSGVWNTIKGWAAGQLEDINKILSSNNLKGWQKLFAFNPITGLAMKGIGTFDRAFEKDAQEQALKEQEAAKASSEAGGTALVNQEAEAVKGLIQQLEEEINKKTELRDLSANTGEIDKLNEEIKGLKEKLELLKMTKAERLEYYKSQQKDYQIQKVEGIFDLDAIDDNTTRAKKMMDNAVEEWKASGERLSEVTLEQQAAVSEAADMMTQALMSGINSSLSELANVIAGVEGANVGSVVSALISPLADACISAGLLIMTTGEGIEALRNSFQTFVGVGSVAAGAALVALGVAAKAGLAAINKNAGGGTTANGVATSFAGGYGINPNNYQQNDNFSLTTTLKGQDLLLSIERTQQSNRR